MITVNGPGGVSVTFPDGTSAATIDQVMKERFSPEPETTLAGVGKSALAGLGEGGIFLAGLPADAIDLATRGYDALTGEKSNDAVKDIVRPFGSENIKKTVEQYTGEFYKPETTTEQFANTIASFAPAMVGGPGGLATKAVTRAVVPGAASELAGQLTKDTDYEPLARIAAGLTGAVAANRAVSAATRPPKAPSVDDISTAKSALYNSQAIKDLEINSGAVNKVVDRIVANLQRERFSAKPGTNSAAATYDQLEMLRRPEFGITHKLADFDATRQRLNAIAAAAGPDGEAARRAIRSIDAFTLRIPKSAVIGTGNAKQASADLFAARKLAAMEFRLKRVTEALERAVNNATSTHSGGNLENEIYKQVRTMLNNPRKHLRGWTVEEKEALRSVLPGRGRGALRRVGKLLGGGGGLGQLMSGGAGGAMFGVPGMLALPMLGMGANKLGSSIATGKINAVDNLLRSRSMPQPPVPAGNILGLPAPQQLLMQGLLASRLPQQQPDYIRR